jgi:hypothetical protein
MQFHGQTVLVGYVGHQLLNTPPPLARLPSQLFIGPTSLIAPPPISAR